MKNKLMVGKRSLILLVLTIFLFMNLEVVFATPSIPPLPPINLNTITNRDVTIGTYDISSNNDPIGGIKVSFTGDSISQDVSCTTNNQNPGKGTCKIILPVDSYTLTFEEGLNYELDSSTSSLVLDVPETGSSTFNYMFNQVTTGTLKVEGVKEKLINGQENSLAGAQITLKDDQGTSVVGVSGTTDANGGASLTVAEGTYTVIASKDGWVTTEKTGVVITANQDTVVNNIPALDKENNLQLRYLIVKDDGSNTPINGIELYFEGNVVGTSGSNGRLESTIQSVNLKPILTFKGNGYDDKDGTPSADLSYSGWNVFEGVNAIQMVKSAPVLPACLSVIKKMNVTADLLDAYNIKDTSGTKNGTIPKGTLVDICEIDGDWTKVKSGSGVIVGWAKSEGLEDIVAPPLNLLVKVKGKRQDNTEFNINEQGKIFVDGVKKHDGVIDTSNPTSIGVNSAEHTIKVVMNGNSRFEEASVDKTKMEIDLLTAANTPLTILVNEKPGNLGNISVTVKNETGAFITNAVVKIQCSGCNEIDLTYISNGVYKAENVGIGTYKLIVSTGTNYLPFERANVIVSAGILTSITDVELLKPSKYVDFKVVVKNSTNTGIPLQDVLVSIPLYNSKEITDDQGKVTFTGLGRGASVEISAEKEGYFMIPVTKIVGDTEITLTMNLVGAMTGRLGISVFDEDGKCVELVKTDLKLTDINNMNPYLKQIGSLNKDNTYCGKYSWFVWNNVPSGEHTLLITKQGYDDYTTSITITPGGSMVVKNVILKGVVGDQCSDDEKSKCINDNKYVECKKIAGVRKWDLSNEIECGEEKFCVDKIGSLKRKANCVKEENKCASDESANYCAVECTGNSVSYKNGLFGTGNEHCKALYDDKKRCCLTEEEVGNLDTKAEQETLGTGECSKAQQGYHRCYADQLQKCSGSWYTLGLANLKWKQKEECPVNTHVCTVSDNKLDGACVKKSRVCDMKGNLQVMVNVIGEDKKDVTITLNRHAQDKIQCGKWPQTHTGNAGERFVLTKRFTDIPYGTYDITISKSGVDEKSQEISFMEKDRIVNIEYTTGKAVEKCTDEFIFSETELNKINGMNRADFKEFWMTDIKGTTHKVSYSGNQFKIDKFWFRGAKQVSYNIEIYYLKNEKPYRSTGTYTVSENPCASS